MVVIWILIWWWCWRIWSLKITNCLKINFKLLNKFQISYILSIVGFFFLQCEKNTENIIKSIITPGIATIKICSHDKEFQFQNSLLLPLSTIFTLFSSLLLPSWYWLSKDTVVVGKVLVVFVLVVVLPSNYINKELFLVSY